MTTVKKTERLLTIEQAAKVLKVNRATLRRWDKSGKLKAIRIGSRKGVGDRRYKESDLLDFMVKKIDEIKTKK